MRDRPASRRALLLWAFALLLGLAALGAGMIAAGALETFESEPLAIETADGTRHDFLVEMALTTRQQAQGLMFRRSMPADRGMLFVYRPARRVSMWMKNTFIPLDMLFVAADGRIVKVVERTVPQSLASVSAEEPVLAVIELNAGTASRLGIAPGDRVLHAAFGSAP